MANQTNVLVKDDANPLVEHTFIPKSSSPNPSWRDTVSGVSFEGQVSFQLREEQLSSGDYKRSMVLEVPVMETLGASGTSAGYVAPQKVAYVEKFYVTHISSRRSTLADRANCLKLALGLLQGATSTTATGTISQASAADVVKTSQAPVPLFFTQGVIPN